METRVRVSSLLDVGWVVLLPVVLHLREVDPSAPAAPGGDDTRCALCPPIRPESSGTPVNLRDSVLGVCGRCCWCCCLFPVCEVCGDRFDPVRRVSTERIEFARSSSDARVLLVRRSVTQLAVAAGKMAAGIGFWRSVLCFATVSSSMAIFIGGEQDVGSPLRVAQCRATCLERVSPTSHHGFSPTTARACFEPRTWQKSLTLSVTH